MKRLDPTAACLAAPVVAYAGFEFLSRILLPPFLTGPLGLSLPVGALLMLLLRCLDVAGDVAFGALCDRFAQRKHWMLLGPVCATPATVVLAFCDAETTPIIAVLAALAALLGWSAFNAGQSALSLEAGDGLIARGRVFAWRSVATITGFTLFAAVTTAAGADTARQMRWAALALLGLTPVLLALALWRVPEPAAKAPQTPFRWRDLASTVLLAWANVKRARLALLFALAGAHAAIWATGFAFTIQQGLNLPTLLGPAVLVQAAAAVTGAFFWSWALVRIGPRQTLALIFAGEVALGALAFALPEGEAAAALAWVAARGLVAGAELMVLRALTGAFLDEEGVRRAGAYAASFHLPFAVGAALFGPLLLWLLHLANFDPATGGRVALVVTAGFGISIAAVAFTIASAQPWSGGPHRPRH